MHPPPATNIADITHAAWRSTCGLKQCWNLLERTVEREDLMLLSLISKTICLLMYVRLSKVSTIFIKRRIFCMLVYALKTNDYSFPLCYDYNQLFHFWYVSQATNKLWKYVWCFICKIMLKWRDFRWYAKEKMMSEVQ